MRARPADGDLGSLAGPSLGRGEGLSGRTPRDPGGGVADLRPGPESGGRLPWRCEATSPECDPGGHPADSAAGQSGICPVASSSRFDPRVLPSRRSQGEVTYLKLNKLSAVLQAQVTGGASTSRQSL